MYFLLVIFWLILNSNCDTPETVQEKKLSQYVLAILEHYKQSDPVGLPEVPIPNPFLIPPLTHSFSGGQMIFKDVKLYHLSKFRIRHVNTNLADMTAEAAVTLDHLLVQGNYTLKTWLSTTTGPFTVTLDDVYVEAIAKLEIQRNGSLEAEDIKMDIKYKHMDIKFENLPFLVENLVNNLGSFILESIKPYILGEMNRNIRTEINNNVRSIPMKFPNSISPLDQLIAEARKRVRAHEYDPLEMKDYKNTMGVLCIELTRTRVTGLSSFHRVGDISLKMTNNTVRADVTVGMQKLEGFTQWDASVGGGVVSKSGILAFTIDYLKVQVVMSQTLDTRKNPRMENIKLELGNIQVHSNGIGTGDYVLEVVVNIVSNLLRCQIMTALEVPLKKRIQNQLDAMDLEDFIKRNTDKLDLIQERGLENILNEI